MKTIKQKIRNISPLYIVLALYFLSVFLISPWGNFSVNDDWDFFIHVKNFSQGDFNKNSLIDATFILQGFIATLWAKIFGLNFVSLRVLTILFTVIFLIGFYKVLKLFNLSRGLLFLVLMITTFNPLLYTSSLTFMTENYFLAFMIWSTYYFLRFLQADKNERLKYIVLSSFIGSLSVLIRQFGIVLFIALTLSYFVNLYLKKEKIRISEVAAIFVPFLITIAIGNYWPQYLSKLSEENRFTELWESLRNPLQIINSAINVLPYLGFFLSPFIILFLSKLGKLKLLLVLIIAAFITKLLYVRDIFFLGNVFYIEGYYVRANFVNDLSIFDNIPFKVFLSFFVSFNVVGFLFWLSISLKNKYRNILRNMKPEKMFLIILTIGMFLVVILMEKIFDRYYLNMFVLLLILLALEVSKLKININSVGILSMVLVVAITLLLNYDFFKSTQNKWEQAMQLQQIKNTTRNIFVTGSYSRLYHVLKTPNSQVVSSLPLGLNYKCYVEKISEKPQNNPLYNLLARVNNSKTVNNYFPYPKVYDAEYIPGFVPISKHQNKIILKEEYKSPIYNLLGRKEYIASFCLE